MTNYRRRYFESALTVGANSGKTLAAVAMKFYQDLFQIEVEIREKEPEQRYEIKLQKAKPIWDEFKALADKNSPNVPPESKLDKAYTYFNNEYEYLIGYLKDGRLPRVNHPSLRFYSIERLKSRLLESTPKKSMNYWTWLQKSR